MITYWELIHCHWVKVTTTIAVWAKLPHVISWALWCGTVVAVVAPPLPNTHVPIPSPGTDYEHYAPLFIPGIEGGQEVRYVPLVPPADVVPVDEPSTLAIVGPFIFLIAINRIMKWFFK